MHRFFSENMRIYVFFIAIALSVTVSGQQATWNDTYQKYINQHKDIAIEQMLRWKVPASITLAQGILESNAGRSNLVRVLQGLPIGV